MNLNAMHFGRNGTVGMVSAADSQPTFTAWCKRPDHPGHTQASEHRHNDEYLRQGSERGFNGCNEVAGDHFVL
jgi:hypothetical protein